MSPDVTRRKLNFLIKNLDLLKKYEKAGLTPIKWTHNLCGQ